MHMYQKKKKNFNKCLFLRHKTAVQKPNRHYVLQLKVT